MIDRAATLRVKDIANASQDRVLRALGISERPRGPTGYIVLCDPRTAEKNPSLVIWTRRPGGLSWKNYSGADKGDIIGLVAYLRGWSHLPYRGFPEAMRFLESLLGIATRSDAELKRDADRARAAIVDADRVAQKDLAGQRRRAAGMWFHAMPIAFTPVITYLQARGIDLTALPRGPRGGERAPHTLRYLANHPHTGDAGTQSAWPCMIAACVDGQGKIGAVHRTWLARDGEGKAPVAPARKCWPGFAGHFIPLWRGESALSVKEANANGLRETLVVTEGIEDGLTAAIAEPRFRVWAAISLSNIGNLPLPECVDSVIIHRQNDWLKPQAVAAFDAARRALEATGRPVAEVAALCGKDINDTLRGAA